MNTYDFFMLPFEKMLLHDMRASLLSQAYGNVLEIGIGTGVNLPYYNFNTISQFTGIDIEISKEVQAKTKGNIRLLEADMEALPFSDNSFDTIVCTLVLCTVKHPDTAIKEIKRVLKPDGQYLFIEHILPSETKLAQVFHTINPAWKKIAYGCNLNRSTDLLLQNEFSITDINRRAKGIFYAGKAFIQPFVNS